jgi:hypothetical protein
MRPAIAYIRVSTKRQGRSGLGIDAQREAVSRFVETEGFKVVSEFTEVETGKGADALELRPQAAAAMESARRINAPVIVAKLDRLSRDVHFISGLMKHRVRFVVTELGSQGVARLPGTPLEEGGGAGTGKAGTAGAKRGFIQRFGWRTMDELDKLDRYDPNLAATDQKAVFAFGIVVGAFVPLVFLALG